MKAGNVGRRQSIACERKAHVITLNKVDGNDRMNYKDLISSSQSVGKDRP